jgi:hypothetical protein
MDPDSKPKGQRTKKGREPAHRAVQVGDCWRQWVACGKRTSVFFFFS